MNLIKLDFYTKENTFINRIELVLKLCDIRVNEYDLRRTKKGWHYRIYLKEYLHDMDLLCLQALMGSAYMREYFNFKRIRKGYPKNWNVLFNEKIEFITGKVLSREH